MDRDAAKHSLPESDWSHLNLTGSDFQSAELEDALFTGANLTDVRFWDANLKGVDFSDSVGLLPDQLAGAVLVGATLPTKIEEWTEVEELQNVSDNGAKVFVSLLLALAFVVLTLVAANDYDMILNSRGVKLPFIGVEVSTDIFLGAAPWLLLTLFFYLHLYLQRIWESLARLPAIFPDGRRVDEMIHPWLLNNLAKSFLPRLGRDVSPMTHIQNGLAWILGWWLVPICLWMLWAFGLKAQNSLVTAMQIVSVGIGAFMSIWFANLLPETFRFRRAGRPAIALHFHNRAMRRACFVGASVCILLWFWSRGIQTTEFMPPSVFAEPQNEYERAAYRTDGFWQRYGPRLLLALQITPYPILPGSEFSKRPSNWTGDEKKAEIEVPLIPPRRLVGKSLRHLWAWQAFAVNADFTGADITGSHFDLSDFRRTVLERLTATNCHFDGSDFTDRETVGLNGPKVTSSDFRLAVFDAACMRGIRASNSSFLMASFVETNAERSDRVDCNFAEADLSKSSFIHSQFKRCSFSCVNFSGADLSNTTFTACYSFAGASFAGCDLRNSNIEIRDLLQARTIKGAIVDSRLQSDSRIALRLVENPD